MYAVDNVGDEMTSWSDQSHTSLAQARMDAMVEEGGKSVADER